MKLLLAAAGDLSDHLAMFRFPLPPPTSAGAPPRPRPRPGPALQLPAGGRGPGPGAAQPARPLREELGGRQAVHRAG